MGGLGLSKPSISAERVVIFELFAYSVCFVVLGLSCGASYLFQASLGDVLAVFSGGPGPRNRTDACPFLVSVVDTWFTVRFRTPKQPQNVLQESPKCPQDAPKWSAAGPQRPLNEDCQWYTVSLNSHFRYEPSLACSLLLLVASFIAPDVVFLVAVPVAHQCPQDVPKLTPGIPRKASN